MPIGSIQTYSQMIDSITPLRPASVLDIGIGMGVNGAGIRNWNDSGYNFKTRLVGVEAFEQYRNPCWGLYDEVIVDDILNVIVSLPNFDAVMMSDVIEHFEKATAIDLVEKLKDITNKILFVSTPAVWFAQGAAYGNEYEVHRSFWNVDEFKNMGFEIVDPGARGYLGGYMLAGKIVK